MNTNVLFKKMNVFAVKTEFDDWASVLKAKKMYEDASKTLLTTSASHKLKTSDDVSKRCLYDRVEFSCKAGQERKSQSKGLRESFTYKMGCTVKVNNKMLKFIPECKTKNDFFGKLIG